jgi:hypothetical protein
VAALGLAGLSRWEVLAAARFPLVFSFDPSLPDSLQTAIPAVAVLWGAARSTVAIAAAAAVVALALPHPVFRKPLGRALAILAVFLALVPSSFHSAPELLASVLPPLATLAYLTVVGFWLLKDHVAAWVLFGALTFGGRGAAALLAQPARVDQVWGWIGLVLVLLAAVALLAGRRPRAPAEPSPVSTPGVTL